MIRYLQCFYGRIDSIRTTEGDTSEALIAAFNDDELRRGESRFLQRPTGLGWRTTSSRVGPDGAHVPGDIGARSSAAHIATDRIDSILRLAYRAVGTGDDAPDPGCCMDLRLRDMLVDALHFCDGHGLDLDAELALARDTYADEFKQAMLG